MVEYAELHCHSCYSLREGASWPRELIERALQLGYRALALTDHDAVYGAMAFSKEANDLGLRGISGAEVTLANGHHLTLLVETPTGWSNLCQLLSHAYLDHHTKDEPRIDLEELAYRAEGLIALSGCAQGEVPALIVAGRAAEAQETAQWYRDCFGPDQFFIELQQNYVQGDRQRLLGLLELAQRLGLPYVATNNVHYHVQSRHRLQDVLVAIRHRTTLHASHELRRPNSEFYLKPPEEMAQLFQELPLALRNTVELADRCGFNLYQQLVYEFPDYRIPAGRKHEPAFDGYYRQALAQLSAPRSHEASFAGRPNAERDEGYRFTSQRAEVDAYLEAICRAAMERRYPAGHEHHHTAQARLQEELRLIRKHNLSGFFLTYYDLLDLAADIAYELRQRDKSLPADVRPIGRGRGSSVSSLVCYLIGLSHIDPIANDLFLGRFLSDEFTSVPDIDLDLPRDIREELLKRVWEHCDRDRAALLCSFSTYRTRSAVRDVGKVLGLPELEVSKLAKMADTWAGEGLEREMRRIPELAAKVDQPLWRHLIEQASQLAGFPRHIGQHVGGIVLCRGSIKDSVPVEPARMAGRYVIQWDKDSVDDARMIKIDFLALGMLSLVDNCLDIIQARGKQVPDLGRIDHAEAATYDRICAGDTVGLFQIESRAQIQTVTITQPRNLDDLAVEVAIVRPGPIVGGALHPYMEYRRLRREGKPVPVHYAHPCLEGVLGDTLGVVLYQEQVLQIAMEAAGFTVGEAERLRRAISRKRSEEAVNAFEQRFVEGCWRKHGMPAATAGQIFASIRGFAAFGFPRSHAVAFALLAYESAWLRYHYPEEYYCALFNNQPMGFYSLEVLVGDARRHHVTFLPPSINRGQAQCWVEGTGRVRLGFESVKTVRLETARSIVAERQAHGPFASLFQFSQRTGLPRDQIESLILAGAFKEFGLGQRELLWQLGLFYRSRQLKVWSETCRGGRGGVPPERRLSSPTVATGDRLRAANGFPAKLLGQPQLDLPLQQDMVRLPGFTDWERLQVDYELMGLSPDLHPFALLRHHLPDVVPSHALANVPEGQRITTAGLVVCRQRPGTANGIVFMLLEDEFGVINVVVYKDLFEAEREVIRLQPLVKIRGQVQRHGPNINLRAEHVEPLLVDTHLLAPEAHNFR